MFQLHHIKIPCFVLVATASLALTACNPPPESGPAARPPSTPTASISVAVAPAPAQPTATPAALPPTTAVVCFDVTTSVPSDVYTKLRDALLALVRNAVQGEEPGLTLYVRLINSHSYSPEAALARFVIPPVRHQPVPPIPSSRPPAQDLSQCQSNPFTRVECEAKLRTEYQNALKKWEAEEKTRKDEYDEAVKNYQKDLAAAQAAQKDVAAEVATLKVEPDDKATDVTGCPLKASELLAQAPGKRLLVMVSDLVPEGPQSEGRLSLEGVEVYIVQYSKSAGRAEELRREWAAKLEAAHAARLQFRDPSEGLTGLPLH